MSTPKPIQIAIEAIVKGQRNVDELANDLRTLSGVLDDELSEHAKEAAEALDALGAKQRALESFKELGTQTRDLSAEFRKAQDDAKRLGTELKTEAAAAKAFAEAEQQAQTAVADAKRSLDSKRNALRTLRKETDAAGKKTEDYKRAEEGLKAAIAAARTELTQRKAALKQAGSEAQKAARAEAALQQEYKGAVSNVRNVSAALQQKRAALKDATAQMQRLGVATTDLNIHERNLKNAIAQKREEVQRMAPAYQQAAAAASGAAVQQLAAQRTLKDGLGDIAAQIQRIQSIAMVALGGSWAIGKAKEIADVADEFKNLRARVELATGEGQLFAQSWEQVSRVAQATYSSLSSTATLFARLTDAGKSAGQSAQAAAQQAMALTETINQAVQLSGASAQASDAAITQLIQGLQSGVLRGEEFNSVMEQAPRLAKAMADGLGVTTGELRKLAGEGALTTEVVIKALQGQADVVANEFGKLPATVGRALENLRTQWMLYVGSADAGLLSTENAAKAINYLAENIDTLINALQTAGKLWAALKIAQLASDFGAWATKTLAATQAMEANTVATAANTAAQKANAAAVGASAAAMGAQAAAAKTSAFIQAELARNAKNAAIFAGKATKAQQAANAAVQGGAKVAADAAGRMGLLGSAVRGVTGLLGGPVGLIATAVLFRSEIESGIRSVVEWGMSFTEAGRQMQKAEAELKRMEATARAQKAAADEAAAAAKRLAQEQEAARNASFGLSKEGQGLIATFQGMVREGKRVDEALAKIGEGFDLSGKEGIQNAAAVLDKLQADGQITAEQFAQAWQGALEGIDLGVFAVNAQTALQGGAREAERLAQVMDAVVHQAVQRTGLDFDVLQGKIGAASRSAINDADAIAAGFNRLKANGVDAGRALQASLSRGIDTADSQQAVEALKGKIEELRAKLGDEVADGLLEDAAQKASELKIAAEDATPGIQSMEEAMRHLGIVTDETLKESAETARKAYEAIRDSGTATPREIALAFEKAADAAEKSADRSMQAWAKAEQQRLRYQQQAPENKPAPDKQPGSDIKPAPGNKPGRTSQSPAVPQGATEEEAERLRKAQRQGKWVYDRELEKVQERIRKDEDEQRRQSARDELERQNQARRDQVANADTGPSNRDLLAEMRQQPTGQPQPEQQQGWGAQQVQQIIRHEIALPGGDVLGIHVADSASSDALNALFEQLERGAQMAGGRF